MNGVQERKLRVQREMWRILTTYNGGKIKEMRKILEKEINELEEEILCIGGDFNAKIEEEGRPSGLAA